MLKLLRSFGQWLLDLVNANETEAQLPLLSSRLAAARIRLAQALSENPLSRRNEMAPSTQLQRLTTEVQETETVIDSAITLIGGLAQQIRDAQASGDPQALTDLANSLDQKQSQLAAAIAANTPAEDTGSTGGTGSGTPDGETNVPPEG